VTDPELFPRDGRHGPHRARLEADLRRARAAGRLRGAEGAALIASLRVHAGELDGYAAAHKPAPALSRQEYRRALGALGLEPTPPPASATPALDPWEQLLAEVTAADAHPDSLDR
jgi:hypothetical protein